MGTLAIPWSPRLLLAGRTFRLPVQSKNGASLEFESTHFTLIDKRYCPADGAWYLYLRAPLQHVDGELTVHQDGQSLSTHIAVQPLNALRKMFVHNSTQWPRRWPLGQIFSSHKTRQTLAEETLPDPDDQAVHFWRSLDDDALWRQLPNAEMPRAHFANVHQGCPQCGTAIFTYGGFYPWLRSHTPIDYRSTCPSCRAVFPSNDLTNDDFTSGPFADDGYGYVDGDGHLFLFAATYARDQVRAFGAGIGHMTSAFRARGDEESGRTLALMLLRYAVETIYLGAVPQFRYGPSEGEEKPWNWGQTDWPGDELGAKGMLRYCIDVPYISETLALAYDAVWPLLSRDETLVARVRQLGLEVERPDDLTALTEEMLACQLQCCLDGGARSNLPRVSQAVLVLLRALDRDDGQDALTWLYDQGPDRLRTFGINNFFPDGTPPEATGGYNSIHSDGLFDLEYHLRALRRLHPAAYSEAQFPSLLDDPRAARVARAPIEIATMGRSWLQFGDGSAPGSAAQLGKAEDEAKRLSQPVFHAPMRRETLERAAEYTGDQTMQNLRDAVAAGEHPPLGSTVHDGVGLAILRTDETPERAAVGICYGDATGHRHMDLLDTQLFAHERVFLGDLGYPQSWASIRDWEAHWATHNSGWGLVDGLSAGHVAGRGQLVHILRRPGLQALDISAERWAWNSDTQEWYRPGVTMRRLLALIETDGEGVLLVDLMRIAGGSTHWRLCRGCGSDFSTAVSGQAQAGTLAGPDISRGDLSNLAHPDCAALAYMDQVQQFGAPDAWTGTWTMDPQAHLDLHQLCASSGTQVRSARATAIMGSPDESTYNFRALSWQREASDNKPTCIDLAFEPRVGPSDLAHIQSIAADGTASGVQIETKLGKRIGLYWAPDADGQTDFADGTSLWGTLAACVDRDIASCASTSIFYAGQKHPLASATQRATVVSVDEANCAVEVEGIDETATGMRMRSAPRGRNYRIERAEQIGVNRWRLALDATTLLGRGRIVSVRGKTIELDCCIIARTGYLHDAYIRTADGKAARIRSACNPDHEHTTIQFQNPLEGLTAGQWIEAVDCLPGDTVLLNATE